jgi:transposase
LKFAEAKGLQVLALRLRQTCNWFGHGFLARILIVALARKLLIAIWRYLEFGTLPTGAVLKST